MKYNITQTENYLLIVDDSDVNNGDWSFNDYQKIILRFNAGVGIGLCKKIIAHLPLNEATVLEGVGLLPLIENEVEELANNMFEEHSTNVLSPQHEMRKMFMYGYNKAKEKYKYTDEDVIKIVEKSRETGLTAEYLMLSLQQPKMPVGFECDIIDTYEKFGDNEIRLFKQKTTTNSQGQTVWVGKYIYETDN